MIDKKIIIRYYIVLQYFFNSRRIGFSASFRQLIFHVEAGPYPKFCDIESIFAAIVAPKQKINFVKQQEQDLSTKTDSVSTIWIKPQSSEKTENTCLLKNQRDYQLQKLSRLFKRFFYN